ncbi:hypothetical protein FJNA_10720 [Thermus sp. FJN-A]
MAALEATTFKAQRRGGKYTKGSVQVGRASSLMGPVYPLDLRGTPFCRQQGAQAPRQPTDLGWTAR